MQQEQSSGVFTAEAFLNHRDPERYISMLVQNACRKLYPLKRTLSVNEITSLLNVLCFNLKSRQIREMVQGAPHHIQQLIKQIYHHLKFKKVVTQSTDNKTQAKYNHKLPIINKIANVKVYELMLQIQDFFSQISTLKQDYGLKPLQFQHQQVYNLRYVPEEMIYKPQMHEENKQINRLRKLTELKIEKFIAMSREYPLLKQIIQQEVAAVIMPNIVHNQKMGKIAAMKAQKRMIQRSQKQIRSYVQQTKDLSFVPHIPQKWRDI